MLRTYGFDAMGNLYQWPGAAGRDTTIPKQFYDSMTNQLRKGTEGFFSYDHAGNLTAKLGTGVTFGYDALERLIWVRHDGVLIARYGYDVVGRRIVKRVYSGATGGTVGYLRMGYAGSQVAFETDSANTSLSTIYTWGPGVDNLLAVRVAGTSYTVVTDALGSVRAVLRQADGVWQGRLAYDPYGQLLDSAGTLPAGRYRWTGREYDAETGFYFHRSRYYDPAVGRFVQEDPAGDAGGPNPYAYVGGNVLQARDPFGAMSDYPPYSWAGLCIADFCFDQYGGMGGGGGASMRLAGLIGWATVEAAVFEAIHALRTGMVTFQGTEAEVEEMRRNWVHIQRALEAALRAGRTNPEARRLLNIMRGDAGPRFSVTFLAGDLSGALGQTGANNTPDETTVTLDLPAIHAAEGYATTATVMSHEFGHAYFNWWSGSARDDWAYGNAYAEGFENAYRWAVGYNPRPGHSCYPPLHGQGQCVPL